jgi:hypothetical protein
VGTAFFCRGAESWLAKILTDSEVIVRESGRPTNIPSTAIVTVSVLIRPWAMNAALDLG